MFIVTMIYRDRIVYGAASWMHVCSAVLHQFLMYGLKLSYKYVSWKLIFLAKDVTLEQEAKLEFIIAHKRSDKKLCQLCTSLPICCHVVLGCWRYKLTLVSPRSTHHRRRRAQPRRGEAAAVGNNGGHQASEWKRQEEREDGDAGHRLLHGVLGCTARENVDDVLKMPLLEFRFCSMFQFQEWTFYSDSDSDFLVVDDEAATSVLEYLWIIKLDFFFIWKESLVFVTP